jgi:hypothetical protein
MQTIITDLADYADGNVVYDIDLTVKPLPLKALGPSENEELPACVGGGLQGALHVERK